MDKLSEPEFKVFKYGESLKRVAGEEPLLETLASIFLEDVDGMTENIRQAIDQRDSSALMMASHTMAGIVGNFSAENAFAYSKSLEKIGKQDQLPNAEAEKTCQELFESLKTELSDLKDDLRCYLDRLSN